MSKLAKLLILCLILSFPLLAQNETDWSKKDWKKPETTEFYEPKPPIVTAPPVVTPPPSDAIVLFDGKNMDNWVMSADGSPSKWRLNEGAMTIALKSGDMKTKQLFGDCQLHVEFKIPADAKSSKYWGDSGNSGIFLQERYEVQIFDSYQNEVPIYSNGQCASLYKQAAPLANACSKPGDWNSYDIYFTAPRFRPNGSVEKPAYITVVHNGVLVLNHFEIQGEIKYIGYPTYDPHGKAAVHIQGHGSEVSFRNIWIRNL
jgi:hypothetical protein